jgi:crotonobetaine/carnitine-CoA ligase
LNIAWWLERAADEYPGRVALAEARTGTSWTYRELRDRSRAVAQVLHDDFGIRAGDVVATLMPDDCWHTAVFFGLQRLGAVFSGFNRTLTFEKFVTDADRLGARLILTGRAYAGIGRQLAAASRIERSVVCDGTTGDESDLAALAAARTGTASLRVVAHSSDRQLTTVRSRR